MDFKAIPLIRLELDHMKHSILSHLGVHESELGKAIDAQIEKAIVQYPFEEQVLRITRQCITEAIENYFKYGEGNKVIKEGIQEALDKVFKKE